MRRNPLIRQRAIDHEGDAIMYSEYHQLPDKDEQNPADFCEGIPIEKVQNMYMINPSLFCIFNRPALRSLPIEDIPPQCESPTEDPSRKSKPAVFGDTFIFSNSFDGYISPTLLDQYSDDPSCKSDKENTTVNINDHGGSNGDVFNKDIITIFTNSSNEDIPKPLPGPNIGHVEVEADLGVPYIKPDRKDIISFFLTERGRDKVTNEEWNRSCSPSESVGEFTPGSYTADIENSNKDIFTFSTVSCLENGKSGKVESSSAAYQNRQPSAPPTPSNVNLKKPYVSLNFSDIIAFFNSEESLLEACENDHIIEENKHSPSMRDLQEDVAASNDVDNRDCFVFPNSPLKVVVLEPSDPSTPVEPPSSVSKELHSKQRGPLFLKRGSMLSFFSDEESFDLASRLGTESDEEEERIRSICEMGETFDEGIGSLENLDIKVFPNHKRVEAKPSKISVPDVNQDEVSSEDPVRYSPVLVVTQEFPDIISFYNPDHDRTSPPQIMKKEERIDESSPCEDRDKEIFESKDSKESDSEAFIKMDDPPEKATEDNIDEPSRPDLDKTLSDVELEMKMITPRRLPSLETSDPIELPKDVGCTKQADLKKKTRKLPTVEISLELSPSEDEADFPEPPESPACLSDSEQEPLEKVGGAESLPPPMIEEVESPIDAYLNVYAFANEETFVHVKTTDDIVDESEALIQSLEEFIEISKDRHSDSVVVADSCSDDGTPIRDVQDIEDLPDIEQAIDMVAAIDDFEMLDLDVSTPDPLGDELFNIDDDEFEKNLTDEIDSLLSEAENLIAPTAYQQEAFDEDDDLERFFEDVADPEQHLLKTDDHEAPPILNISVVLPCEEVDSNFYKDPIEVPPAPSHLRVPNINEPDQVTPSLVIHRAPSPAPIGTSRGLVFVADPLHYPVEEFSRDSEPYDVGDDADIDSDTEYETMHEAHSRSSIPKLSPDDVTILQGAHPRSPGMLVLAPVTYQRVFPFDFGSYNTQPLFETLPPPQRADSVDFPAHIEEIDGEDVKDEEEGRRRRKRKEEEKEDCVEQEHIDEEEMNLVEKEKAEHLENVGESKNEPTTLVETATDDRDDPGEETRVVESLHPKIEEKEAEAAKCEYTDLMYTRAVQTNPEEENVQEEEKQCSDGREETGCCVEEPPCDTPLEAEYFRQCSQHDGEDQGNDGDAKPGPAFAAHEQVAPRSSGLKKEKKVLESFIDKLANNYIKLHTRSLIVPPKKVRNIPRKGTNRVFSYSTMAKLGKMIADRVNARGDFVAKPKRSRPHKRSSDISKMDKKHFSDLQQRFDSPEPERRPLGEICGSQRSDQQQRRGIFRSWVPVEVIPQQVDISYSEVNPIDVEVQIPDLGERRTPIARLFNDTSSSSIRSPSPPAGTRIVSPRPNVFVPVETVSSSGTSFLKKYPDVKILGKVAMYERLSRLDSKRRPVSPGPESRYLGSLENLTEEPNNGHGGIRRTASLNRGGVLEESGNYNGSLRPVSARKPTTMFQPSWRKESPDAGKTAGEKRPQSPHWQSFTEAAFGTACPPVTGEVDSNLAAGQKECPPTIASGTTHSVRAPSHSPIRMRNFSTDSLDNSRANVSPSGNSTHVDRLARSGSAASLAVVMASTFPNGGNANFDLEGTAAKISEVCKSLTNSQSDIAACGTVHLTRSRSMNSVNLVASPDLKRSNRPQIYLDKNTSNKLKIRSATTPERRVVEPMKATKPAPSFKEIKDLQEKLKEATTISYTDLITCPRHRLPAHIDKLRLQDYLSDTEFTDVFKITREQFKRLAVWKQTQLKKEALLF